MKQLCRLHGYIISKCKFYYIFSFFFAFVIPILLKQIDLISKKSNDTFIFNLGEIMLIEFFFIVIILGYYYYKQQKSNIYLLEILSGYSKKNMLIMRILVSMILCIPTIGISHIGIILFWPSIFNISIVNILIIFIIYSKHIILASLFFIFVRDALLASVLEWFWFAVLHVVVMIMNEFQEKGNNFVFSYTILCNGVVEGISCLDVMIWFLLTMCEIIFLIIMIKLRYKMIEWR